MFVRLGSTRPRHEWALPAYKQVLGHPAEDVRRKVAKAIGETGRDMPGLADALLEALRLGPNKWPENTYTFRSALRAVGWRHASRNAPEGQVPTPPETAADGRCRSAWAMLDDRSLYDCDDDYDNGYRAIGREIDLDDRAPEARLGHADPLVRARALAILTTRRPPTSSGGPWPW